MTSGSVGPRRLPSLAPGSGYLTPDAKTPMISHILFRSGIEIKVPQRSPHHGLLTDHKQDRNKIVEDYY